MTPEEEVAVLRAENAIVRERNARLLERVQGLEARLATDTDMSSQPPSGDGLARKMGKLRRKGGKQIGWQLSHPGETIWLVAEPDEVIDRVGGAAVVLRERRQVDELSPLRLVSRQH